MVTTSSMHMDMEKNMESLGTITGFTSLPPLCVALIFSHTTPQDVVRLARACSLFKIAADFDIVWETMLRHSSVAKRIIHGSFADSSTADLALLVQDNPFLLNLTYKNLYLQLCNSVCFVKETKMYWLEKLTGRENYSVSARALSIIWGNDTRYWEWIATDRGSRFQETAYLLNVCWFDVCGQLKTEFQQGSYVVLFRIKMVRPSGWDRYSVTFSLSTSTGVETHFSQLLDSVGMPSSRNEWIEIEVGQFTVHETQAIIELNFSMKETTGLNWKNGIMLDGAVIRSVL